MHCLSHIRYSYVTHFVDGNEAMRDQKREYPGDGDRHPGMIKTVFLLRKEVKQNFNVHGKPTKSSGV